MHNCDRIFFRREYLLVHLETTHKLPREEAKDLSHRVNLDYVDRQFVEPCGPTEKKLKTTVVLPCDLEANNNEKHDDESGGFPVKSAPNQIGSSQIGPSQIGPNSNRPQVKSAQSQIGIKMKVISDQKKIKIKKE
jgi:hypothetical protein